MVTSSTLGPTSTQAQTHLCGFGLYSSQLDNLESAAQAEIASYNWYWMGHYGKQAERSRDHTSREPVKWEKLFDHPPETNY